MRPRLGILISGEGSTMGEIIKACEDGRVGMTIGCIIASTRHAGGIPRAMGLGLREEDIFVIDPADSLRPDGGRNHEAFGERLRAVLRRQCIDVVTQNGWLPKTPEAVIDAYPGTIYNQHPGPVLEFGGKGMYGKRVHAAVLHFRRLGGTILETETIAQRVARDFDAGAVVKRTKVPLQRDDIPESLQLRAMPFEHITQIGLLRDIVNGAVREIPHEPWLKPEEEGLLAEAKRLAIAQCR